MKDLYHGCQVKYNGYKTTKDGHTVEAICTATVIGWDENTIYTDFKIAAEQDRGVCYYCDPEVINFDMVWIDFRIGFHRSRLIEVIQPFKTQVNHQVIQASLFN